MNNLILPEKSSHWYWPDGRPCYELPMKTRPGEMRTPNVSDAKALGLLPSVTGILNMIHKPALQNWIAVQHVLSALTLPRLEGESQDAFARRVVQDARVEGQRAADFGTNVHALAEGYLNNNLPETLDAVELSFLQGFMDWCQKHEVVMAETERAFANVDEMYGGRLDFLGSIDGHMVVADWKTQGTTPGKAMNFYPDWGPQLAAYKHGISTTPEELKMVSVVISSTEPGRVEECWWEWGQEPWCWEAFKAAKVIYYSPLGPGWKLVR